MWLALQQLVGIHMHQVANQDGNALTETSRLARPFIGSVLTRKFGMGCWFSASCCRTVHHIVMKQRACVQ
jgi:hypothetical protein